MNKERGVALFAALGILVVVGMIASVFLSFMNLENQEARVDNNGLKAHYLAAAGVNVAIRKLGENPEAALSRFAEAKPEALGAGEFKVSLAREGGEGTYKITSVGSVLKGEQLMSTRKIEALAVRGPEGVKVQEWRQGK